MEPGREGGMWLGLKVQDTKLKFATLLNVTGEKKVSGATGRGPLVYDYLKTSDGAVQYVKGLQNKTFTAFNLFMLEITTDKSICYHHSNSPEDTLEYSGFQVLSFGNSTPNAPFTKVKNGLKQFEEIVSTNRSKSELINQLLIMLKSEDKHVPDPEIERRAPGGVDFLSAIYVQFHAGGYGTRYSYRCRAINISVVIRL